MLFCYSSIRHYNTILAYVFVFHFALTLIPSFGSSCWSSGPLCPKGLLNLHLVISTPSQTFFPPTPTPHLLLIVLPEVLLPRDFSILFMSQ